MQNFGADDAMAGFVSLESVAEIYARVMGAWLEFSERLPLQWHRVRYEDLITNFEAEARQLQDFLGVGGMTRCSTTPATCGNAPSSTRPATTRSPSPSISMPCTAENAMKLHLPQFCPPSNHSSMRLVMSSPNSALERP